MNKQPIRHRSLALAAAVAALVALFGAGHAVATQAGEPDEPAVVPDERVLERQGRIDHQAATRQAGEQGRVALPPRLSSEDRAAATQAGTPRRFIRPEPPMAPAPQLGDEQVAPAPTAAPAGARGGLLVIVVVAALLLAVGAATTWRVRRRPQPESTA